MPTGEIKLTPLERLMLANQYRILTKVDPEYATFYRLDEKIDILEGGYEGQYGFVLGSFPENSLSPDDCRLVQDVLAMSSIIMDLKGTSNVDFGDFEQVEFDANNEGDFLSYAEFLLKYNGSGFPGVTGVVNAHHSTLPMHRARVAEWKKLGKQPGELTEADVAKIIGGTK